MSTYERIMGMLAIVKPAPLESTASVCAACSEARSYGETYRCSVHATTVHPAAFSRGAVKASRAARLAACRKVANRAH